MRPAIAALLAGLLAVPAFAATPPTAHREIARLVDTLGQSGCRFQRNGTWYAAPAAREHLQRKLDYLDRRGGVDSAERFIAVVGTKSSMSGRAYRVQCPGAPEVDSATWLREALQRLRRAR